MAEKTYEKCMKAIKYMPELQHRGKIRPLIKMEPGKRKRKLKREPITFVKEMEEEDDIQFSVQQHTSCLFCATTVPLREVETTEFQRERSELVKNICDLLKLSGIQIPEYCPEAMVPLCWRHEKDLKELWNLQQTVMKQVSEFETGVAHFCLFWGEGIVSRSNNEVESEKLVQLRDMIANGYGNKLHATTHSEQDSPTSSRMCNSVIYSVASDDDDDCETEVEDDEESVVEFLQSNVESPQRRIQSFQNVDLNLNGNGLDFQVPERNSDDEESDASSTFFPPSINVGDLRDNFDPVARILFPPPHRQRIEVEKKPDIRRRITVKHDVELDPDGEDNASQASGLAAPLPNPHLIYEGVEIFRTRSHDGYEYLRCGICSHLVKVRKSKTSAKGGLPPSTKLKIEAHVVDAHKKPPSKRVVIASEKTKRRRRSRLSKNMDSEVAAHRQTQDKTKLIECEICGRIVPRPYLPEHRFTHKNDAERKAALKAREPGARPKCNEVEKVSASLLMVVLESATWGASGFCSAPSKSPSCSMGSSPNVKRSSDQFYYRLLILPAAV
ncbi:hypothetical protein Ocin01_13920 [Orchesella cincta]|uniref:Uncharacterized protein n=1 Tax=Orchesella cincta TaxID=48709 RepID=A0A1D2MID0_ORCCI|nr:hypothetical protein Ocin01_13920 [Orchesella cincta]